MGWYRHRNLYPNKFYRYTPNPYLDVRFIFPYLVQHSWAENHQRSFSPLGFLITVNSQGERLTVSYGIALAQV